LPVSMDELPRRKTAEIAALIVVAKARWHRASAFQTVHLAQLRLNESRGRR
jgi:hypothetical protein